jgi:hypothetical protein
MKFLLHATLLAALLAACQQSAMAQARTYDALGVDVPFKFNIGNRTFRPGHYQFVLVGPGLVALRDAKAHTIASLITRSIEIGWPAPETKLVFETKKKQTQLARICIQFRLQVLEVLGEQVAMRQSSPLPAAEPAEVGLLLNRRAEPGLKH